MFIQFVSCPYEESLPPELQDLARKCDTMIANGDPSGAIKVYNEAIELHPNYSILFANRSAALAGLEKYSKALSDAIRARELNPRWSMAYYHQGIALQGLGRHADALAAFASGLSHENKNTSLLVAFIEAALKSPFRAGLEPIYRQLQAMQLDKSPFVLTSVVGQELLSEKHLPAAVVILESSLRIGTCSMKLRGSVYSSLATAYWQLGNLEKALQFMMSDMQVSKSLGDQLGECRAHGNIGAAHFSNRSYQESLSSHRQQLVLAMKGKYTDEASFALSALGHVYAAMGDLPNSLASHRQCLQLVRQTGDVSKECSETGCVASILMILGVHDEALEMFEQHVSLAISAGIKQEEAKAYSCLAAIYHAKGQYEKSVIQFEKLLKISQDLNDRKLEARAFAGLGHTARSLGDIVQAKRWFSRQLETALSIKDEKSELGKALSNLGSLYQLMSDFDGALKLHWQHLQAAKELGDASGECIMKSRFTESSSHVLLHEIRNGSSIRKYWCLLLITQPI